MAYASSQMSEEELDFLYEQALNDEKFDAQIDYDDSSYDDEIDAYHAVYGDVWTDEDETALEEFEENRRAKIAERNEY